MMSGNYTTIDNQNVSGSVPAVSDSPGQVSVKFNDTSLQTFPPSGAQGKISAAAGPPRDADDTFSKPASGSPESPSSGGWFKMFTVAAYRPYFDVDTSDVLERIKDSLLPFNGSFNEKTANNPDLYGPFWICTTLIFVAASIGTFVTYLAHKLQHKEWNYDINLVTWSAGVFYGYVLIVPLCLYVILKYFSAPSTLVQLFCLYGYSLFVFIPAMCLSVIPVELFRWVITGVAGIMSALFVALNLRNHIVSAGERWFLIVVGIFLLQLALSFVLKLYLFNSHSGSPDGSDNGGCYPPNYRYGNCLESDDELEVSDYEDENEDGLDDEEDYDYDDEQDGIICQEVWCESIPVHDSLSESRTESCLSPVLKPVENLSQWKALKTTPKPLSFDPQKENFSVNSIPFASKNANQETAVEASLNWMVTPEKNSPNNKRVGYYNADVEPISSGKSFSQESTVTSVKSIEDRPILGALTADELKQFSGVSSCTPRKSPSKSPDDMPIIGSVGSYWSHTSSAQSLSPTSAYKGIPNATSKYREDKKVKWQNISFETRLERALSADAAEC